MYYRDRISSNPSWAIPYPEDHFRTYAREVYEGPIEPLNPEKPTQTATVVHLRRDREHAKARFRMLRRLQHNHDGEGAQAAIASSIDNAIAFIDRHSFSLPIMATLDDDGYAVIELHSTERGIFADIAFKNDGLAEVYFKLSGAASEFFEGPLASAEAKAFLTKLDVR